MPYIRDFIAQDAEYSNVAISDSIIHMPCEKPVLYKTEFAEFLADSIEEILNKA